MKNFDVMVNPNGNLLPVSSQKLHPNIASRRTDHGVIVSMIHRPGGLNINRKKSSFAVGD